MPVPPDDQKCAQCRFFIVTGTFMGVCKRYPHELEKNRASWCGEFVRIELRGGEQKLKEPKR